MKTLTSTQRGRFPSPRLASALLAGAFLLQTAGLSQPTTIPHYKDTFPKLGGPFIGVAAGSAVRDAQLAKYDLVVLNYWPGRHSNGKTLEEVVQDIKSINPNILIGNYTNIMEVTANVNDTATADLRAKLSSSVGPEGNGGTWTPSDWWAHDNAGGMLSSNTNTPSTNITGFVTPDENGDRWVQWFAKREVTQTFGVPGGVVIPPSLDFVFSDNTFYRPRVAADWNRDGINDNRDDPVVRAYYRQGHVNYWNALHQLVPDKFIMGNVDGSTTTADSYLDNAQYRGGIQAALFESAMGLSFSEETFAGWSAMMGSYRRLIANTAAPHIVAFNTKSSTLNNFPFLRYALASCLMDDGYFTLSALNSYGRPEDWYDEFDLKLGHAIDGPQLTAYQNGVYRRRFENGMAIVNPKGNGAQTITIEPGYRHFVGGQDPVTNNGEPVTSVTLGDRQGLILVRNQTPVADAGPDQTVAVEVDATADVVLDGRGSIDAENDPLSYTWSWNGGSTTGDLAVATLPYGENVVTLTVDDGVGGSATDTVIIRVIARSVVRHAPTLNGQIDGTVQVLLPESFSLNSSANISASVFLPGTPTVQVNGHPNYGGIVDGTGSVSPTGYQVTINGSATVGHITRRVDPVVLPTIPSAVPTGTRDVTLNNASQSPGDFSTLRNLTLNNGVGPVTIPPGTYGTFTANAGSQFVLGVAGSGQPAVYNLQSLALNSNADLVVAGPVVLTLNGGTTVNQTGIVGAADQPGWLTLQVAAGGVTLNSGARIYGHVVAPNGTITLNGGAVIQGGTISDRLTVNGGSSVR